MEENRVNLMRKVHLEKEEMRIDYEKRLKDNMEIFEKTSTTLDFSCSGKEEKTEFKTNKIFFCLFSFEDEDKNSLQRFSISVCVMKFGTNL